jgi:predicted MFS family arabinose efflux permease
MLADSSIRKVLATSSLLHTGQDLYQFYMPVYMHAAGLSASATGMVLAANAAAAFVIRLILPRLIAKFGEEGLLAYAFYAGGVSLMLIPFFTSAVMLGVVSFIFGLGLGCSQPIITMLMFSNSAEGRSGEAMGLRMTVNHLTKLVGPVAFGAVGTALGLMPMFWLNAIMMGAAGMLSRPTNRDQ